MSGLVVGVDGSTQAERALDWALAEAAGRGVALTAVHAWVQTWDDPVGPVPVRSHPDDSEATFAAKQTYVTSLVDIAVERAGGAPKPTEVVARQVHGWPAEVLLRLADEQDADMVVVGRSGLGRFGRFLLGSVSSSVVQHASVPVTVVAHEAPPVPMPSDEPPRVVVGVDGSEHSVAALREGAADARRLGAVLDVVYAWQITTLSPLPSAVGWVPPVDDYEAWALSRLREAVTAAELDLPADRIHESVVHASPSRGVLDACVGADRVVVGSRGLGGFERLVLGSVSRQVLEAAPCPVTVVRA
jgi:nucleotide-binding universal stress UspA family protein